MAQQTQQNEKKEEEEKDIIASLIGDFGKWQLLMTFLLSLFNIPCTWNVYALTFQAPEPNYWCTMPQNLANLTVGEWKNFSRMEGSTTYSPCTIWNLYYDNITYEDVFTKNIQTSNVRECTHWTYEAEFEEETITSQWDLVCGNTAIRETAQTMLMAGFVVGGLIAGALSDKYGRKTILMISHTLNIVLGVVIVFVPWVQLLLLLRFLIGVVTLSVMLCCFVLAMELIGGRWKTVTGVATFFTLPLSCAISVAISYQIRDWRTNQLAVTLPGLLLLPLWRVLPESPRWLLVSGKTKENIAVLSYAANFNKRTLPADFKEQLKKAEKEAVSEDSAKMSDLLCHRYTRKIFILLCVLSIANYFCYYGLVVNTGKFGGDIYLNTLVAGVAEIPAIAISLIILLKTGRKWPSIIGLLGCALACFLTIPFDGEWTKFGLTMAAKFLVSVCNSALQIYSTELFPTVLRNLGLGASFSLASVALIFVPYLWDSAHLDAHLPMGILGVVAIIGAIATMLLPETVNRPLFHTIEDQDRWRNRKKISSNENLKCIYTNKAFSPD